MPKFRKAINSDKKPEGWSIIEETVMDLTKKRNEINNEGNKYNLNENLWKILRLHHQISRYVYEMYYFKKGISKEVYKYCADNKLIDENLIAKWKKPGFEKLCCLNCAEKNNHNSGTSCICRVPKKDISIDTIFECKHCGCKGCVTYDLK